MLAIVFLIAVSLIPVPIVKGEASYYSNKECSDPTASGEKFDDTKLTFAMRKGEFNRLYMIACDNGITVARLNDRGPYIKNRVADLSKATMEQIKGNGLVKVTIFELPFKLDTTGKLCYNRSGKHHAKNHSSQ